MALRTRLDPCATWVDVAPNAINGQATNPAWEVTSEQRWRDIVEEYWRCAVTERGYFCTGGQTSDEAWCPLHELAHHRGHHNQEHCVVYNMQRLANYLFRWTGDVTYADYCERNLYNGILAQQNANTGMVAYYPLWRLVQP